MKKQKRIIILFILMMIISNFLVLNQFNIILASEAAPAQPQTEVPTEESVPEVTGNENQNNQVDNEPIYENTIAKVIKINENKESETGIGNQRSQEVVVEIIKGDYIGEEFTVDYISSYDGAGNIKIRELSEGDNVLVQITEGQDGTKSVVIQDIVKNKARIVLAVIFIISVIVLYGKKSIKSLILVLFTIAITYGLLIAKTYDGSNMQLLSVATMLLIVVMSNLLLLGFNKNSLVGIISNLISVLIVALLTILFGNMSYLSGMMEETMQLNINASLIKFDLYGLIFVMMMLASIGMFIDITVNMISRIEEIKRKDSDVEMINLFKIGLEVGKDVASTKFTMVILVFTSFIIAPFLLYRTNYDRMLDVLNKEMIAENIMIALILEIGIIICLVLTALFYALINREKVIYNKSSKNRVEGVRSLKL